MLGRAKDWCTGGEFFLRMATLLTQINIPTAFYNPEMQPWGSFDIYISFQQQSLTLV